MKVELVRKDCIFIAETEEESEILDTVFGTAVDENGLIGVKQCECRLADGYLEHYVLIKDKEDAPAKAQALEASPISFPLDFFTPLTHPTPLPRFPLVTYPYPPDSIK